MRVSDDEVLATSWTDEFKWGGIEVPQKNSIDAFQKVGSIGGWTPTQMEAPKPVAKDAIYDENDPDRSDMLASPKLYKKNGLLSFSFLNKCDFSPFDPLSDEDFAIAKLNKPFIPNRIPAVAASELVVIDMAHVSHLINQNPKDNNDPPVIMAWVDLSRTISLDFPALFNSSYKAPYQALNPEIHLISLASPQYTRLDDLKSIRRDLQFGRIIFHFIGCGYPPVTPVGIPTGDSRIFSMESLYSILSPPSLFIFDCDNAAILLPTLAQLTSSKARRQPYQMLSSSGSWDDYFCLCATQSDEELPKDPYLPRDFLTSVLLSPIRTAIHCHMHQFYRSPFLAERLIEPPGSPETHSRLSEFLDVLVDSIVSDCLPQSLMRILFRTEPVVRTLFRNFILAQQILKPYRVHPISKPEIPDLSGHYLWQFWSSAIDDTICSTVQTHLSFTTDFFNRSLQSFSVLLNANQQSKIPSSILCAVIKSSKGPEPMNLISKLLFSSKPARDRVCDLCLFKEILGRLSIVPMRSDEFKSVCYILCCLLHSNLHYALEVEKDFDLSSLIGAIFCEDLPNDTRTYAATVLASIAVTCKPLKSLVGSSEFFDEIKPLLTTSSPSLYVWILLLIKRVYDVFSADLKVFLPSGFHIQCAAGVFHKSFECRAVSVSVLPCFMQGSKSRTNLRLMLYAVPVFSDMSYLVRHQLVMLILRFLTTHHDELSASGPPKVTNPLSFSSISPMFRSVESVESFFESVESSSIEKIGSLVQFLVTYFAYDPHNSIAAEAATARGFFQTWKRSANEEEEDGDGESYLPFESDADALYNIEMRQTVDSDFSKDRSFIIDRLQLPQNSLEPAGELEVKSKVVFDYEPLSITFDPSSTGVAVNTGTSLMYFDDKLSLVGKVHFSSALITDLKVATWSGIPQVVSTCANGCSYVWTVGCDQPSLCWRSDANFMNANIKSFIALAVHRPQIITARGNNAVAIWDVGEQRIVSEISGERASNVSALATCSSDENLLFVGYRNGRVNVSDIRGSEVKRIEVSYGSPVMSIGSTSGSPFSVYSACCNGKCVSWNLSGTQAIDAPQIGKLKSFCVHQTLPVLLFSSDATRPLMTNKNGIPIQAFQGADMGCVCAAHPSLPLFAVGSPSNGICTYQLSYESKQ